MRSNDVSSMFKTATGPTIFCILMLFVSLQCVLILYVLFRAGSLCNSFRPVFLHFLHPSSLMTKVKVWIISMLQAKSTDDLITELPTVLIDLTVGITPLHHKSYAPERIFCIHESLINWVTYYLLKPRMFYHIL